MTCGGSSTCASSARTPRSSSICSASGRCSRKRPFGAPENAVRLYRRMLEIRPSPRRAPCDRWRASCAPKGTPTGAAEVIALDRDQREGMRARGARDRAREAASSTRCIGTPTRWRRASAHSSSRRTIRGPWRSSSSSSSSARRAREPPRSSNAPTTRRARRGDRRRSSRSSSRRRRRATIGSLSTGVSRTCTRRSSATRMARSTSIARAANEFPSELPLWDRLAALSADTGRAQDFAAVLVAAVPDEGPTGLSGARRARLGGARGDPVRREARATSIVRRPYLERMLARQPGNEKAFQRLKQILTTREQWDRARRALRARRRGHRRRRPPGGATRPRSRSSPRRSPATGRRPSATTSESSSSIPCTNRPCGRSTRSTRPSSGGSGSLDSSSAAARARWATRSSIWTSASGRCSSRSSETRPSALSYLEQVLRERTSATQARQLVEKILDVPELRARAAIVLEAVYATRDEVPELVRVLEIHLEFATQTDERRDLLRRVADLRDERLRDDAGALEAFARLLPLDPDDARARQRMLDIARRLERPRARGRCPDDDRGRRRRAGPPRRDPDGRRASLRERPRRRDARRGGLSAGACSSPRTTRRSRCPRAAPSSASTRPRRRASQLREVLRIEVRLEDDAATPAASCSAAWASSARRSSTTRAAPIEAWRVRLDDDPATRRPSRRSTASTSARRVAAISSTSCARASARPTIRARGAR